MRKIALILATFATWLAAWAVPAKPGLTKIVTQSDGTTITLRMVGDEWHHSWVTSDGKPTMEAANGDMVYRTADGPSDLIAHEKANRSAAEEAFLSTNAESMTAKAIMASSSKAQARHKARRRGPAKAAGDPDVPKTGTPKIPIILIQYSDVSMTFTKSQFQTHYTSTTGKSAYKYYYDQSNGLYGPQFDVYGPYTLNSSRATYGANDSNGDDKGVAKMVGEAIDKAGSDINWANYDNDSDGEADVCIVVYAGVGEASSNVANSIWPCQWSLSDGASYGDGTGARTRNGKKIDKFAVFNELDGYNTSKMDGIGTFCHEYGHCMGLPDFYETTYDNGYYGMGNWDLMCSGSYNDDGDTPVGFNAYEKEFMGWFTPSTPVENHQYTLPTWNAGNDVAYKVTSPLNSNECYYLENRTKQGWDAYIKDEGMLVTHLTYVASRWTDNTPNNEAIQLFTIIPADNKLSENNETADCFGESNHELTDTSTPAAKLNMKSNGSLSSNAGLMGQPLTEIYLNSSTKDVTFWYMKGNTTPLSAPTLNDASNITTEGWTASWSSVANAGTYELQIDPSSGGSSGSSEYVKVTSSSDLSDGQYLIVYEDGSLAFDGSRETLDASGNTISVTISDNKIASSTSVDASAFTYNANAGTFKSASGYYIGNNNNSNSLTASTTALTNTVSISNGNADIVSSGGAYLRYNATSGQERFRYFKSSTYTSQKAIQLYKLNSGSSSAPQRAAATSRTITGITSTSYTVTGMNDDTDYTFKVRAIPAANDADHSTSDWSNVKSVHTNYNAANHEPTIVADESKTFSAYVNETATADVNILYEDLTADITATISGTNASMFSCANSITRDSSGEANLTVTYSPTAVGTHTATLTLSSTGAESVIVTLTGTATLAPIVTTNPVMGSASAITTNSFTATWTDATDAEAVESYTLYVNKHADASGYVFTKVTDVTTLAAGDEIILVDETANVAAGAFGDNKYMGTADVTISDSQITPNSDVNVLTLEASGSSFMLKTSIENAYLYTSEAKKLTTNSSGTPVTLTNDNGVYFSSTLGRILYNASNPRFLNYTSNLNTSMRLPSIYKKTATSSNAPRKASESGNADNGGLTVTGITDKTYTVTGLTPAATYDFKVKAIYTSSADRTESGWSNIEQVTLEENDEPAMSVSTDALTFTCDNNSSAQQTLTVTGAHLTGNLSVAVSGNNASLFMVSPATITPTDGAVNQTITVTYTPTAVGSHNATLTVSGGGATTATVTLTGTATLSKGTLSLNEAIDVTSSSFKASWTDDTPAENVASYTLYVNKKPEITGYELVTDASTLAAGDQLIITNSKAEGSAYAISTDTKNTNYLAQEAVTINNGPIIEENGLGEKVETFTLGGSSGAWHLQANSSKNTGKYLCTASSTLKLGYSSTLNNYSKMSIAINSTSNVATMTFVSGATNKTIEYYANQSNFTVYNTSSANVYIFRKVGTGGGSTEPGGGDDPQPSTPTLLLTETFNGVTATSDLNTRIESSLDTYCDNAGWTGSYVYQAGGGGLKFGNSSNCGYLTSPALDLSSSGGKVTVNVFAKTYGTDNTSLKVQSGSHDAVTKALSSTASNYIFVVDCDATTGQTVTLTGVGKRHYLYFVEIYSGDASASLSSAPRRVVATEGNADDGGLTVTGITDKEYTVTGLTPGATYDFKVKAVYADNSESAFTEENEVTLLEASMSSLAEVLASPSGDYTIGSNLVVVASAPQGNMYYATDGTDWLPILDTKTTHSEGDKLTKLAGTFNGSRTAPVFTLASAEASTENIDYEIESFFLGQDLSGLGRDAKWNRMPAAGEVAYFYGYFFNIDNVPTLCGYSTGTGRSLILEGDYFGDVTMRSGVLCKATVAVELAEAWSGAPRRIGSDDDEAYTNLRGQLLAVVDNDPIITSIGTITAADATATSVRYYNAAGQKSDTPFKGLNIVVTTHADGTVTATKQMR